MRPAVAACLLFIVHCFAASAQVSISSDVPVTVTFGSTVSGVEGGCFTASGFVPAPGSTSGRLNSNAWAVSGFSDATLGFGGSSTAGDLARGTTTMPNPTTDVGATVSGIYSYTGSPFSILNPAMLIQTGDADFSPGTLTLKITNSSSTEDLTVLDAYYDLWERNNKSSSISFNFAWSTDNVTYYSVPALNYSTPAASDALGIVSQGTKFYEITGISITPGNNLYLRWAVAAVSGTGERDEIYFDNVTLSAPLMLPVSLLYFTAAPEINSVALNWATASEENTSSFIVERSSGGNEFIPIGELNAAGTSSEKHTYTFTDENPVSGFNYYRLKQTDIDGKFIYSRIEPVNFMSTEKNDLVIFPNPSSGIINAEFSSVPEENTILFIYDAAGNAVREFDKNDVSGNNTISLDLSSLPAGLYFLRSVSPYAAYSAAFMKQ